MLFLWDGRKNFFWLLLSNPDKWDRDLWFNKVDLLSMIRKNFSLIAVDKETGSPLPS